MSTIKLNDIWGQAQYFSDVKKIEVPQGYSSGYISYYEPAGTMSISSNGIYSNQSYEYIDIVVPQGSAQEIVDKFVTKTDFSNLSILTNAYTVAPNVFLGCTNVSITAPSLRDISYSAFKNCQGLSVTMPDGVNVYSFGLAVSSQAANKTLYLKLGSNNSIGTVYASGIQSRYITFVPSITSLYISKIAAEWALCDCGFYGVEDLYIYGFGMSAYGCVMNNYSRNTLNIHVSASFIPQSAFQNDSCITTAFIDTETIYSSAFRYCIGLNNVTFTRANTIGSSAFYQCSGLSRVNSPTTTMISQNAFTSCIALQSAYFSNVSSIDNYAFANCTNFEALHIGTSNCQLGGSSAFTGMTSKFAIYVPSDYVSAYQSATNWVYWSSRIVSEG